MSHVRLTNGVSSYEDLISGKANQVVNNVLVVDLKRLRQPVLERKSETLVFFVPECLQKVKQDINTFNLNYYAKTLLVKLYCFYIQMSG